MNYKTFEDIYKILTLVDKPRYLHSLHPGSNQSTDRATEQRQAHTGWLNSQPLDGDEELQVGQRRRKTSHIPFPGQFNWWLKSAKSKNSDDEQLKGSRLCLQH